MRENDLADPCGLCSSPLESHPGGELALSEVLWIGFELPFR